MLKTQFSLQNGSCDTFLDWNLGCFMETQDQLVLNGTTLRLSVLEWVKTSSSAHFARTNELFWSNFNLDMSQNFGWKKSLLNFSFNEFYFSTIFKNYLIPPNYASLSKTLFFIFTNLELFSGCAKYVFLIIKWSTGHQNWIIFQSRYSGVCVCVFVCLCVCVFVCHFQPIFLSGLRMCTVVQSHR